MSTRYRYNTVDFTQVKIEVTKHAIDRYIQRVEQVDEQTAHKQIVYLIQTSGDSRHVWWNKERNRWSVTVITDCGKFGLTCIETHPDLFLCLTVKVLVPLQHEQRVIFRKNKREKVEAQDRAANRSRDVISKQRKKRYK